MVPSWEGCNTLKGVLQAVKKVAYFDIYRTAWRAPGIDLFDQESVNRCILGCSKCFVSDFWICHQLAICWAIKCWFLRFLQMSKSSILFAPPQILLCSPINWHKCIIIYELTEHFYGFFGGGGSLVSELWLFELLAIFGLMDKSSVNGMKGQW